jgi:hypothetical protein
MLESRYQGRLIKKIRNLFPGCYVLKNDSSYQQGIPDLLVLYRNMWAMIEVKPKPPTGPGDFEQNQEWFIEEFDRMSFAAVIYPENEEEVLHDLQRAFQTRR